MLAVLCRDRATCHTSSVVPPAACVFVVDDQRSYRSALATLLSVEDELSWVGEAATGEEALRVIGDLVDAGAQVDVVLMDINMPGQGGIWATRQLVRRYPELQVVLMSTYDPEDLPVEPAACGARGYVHKEQLAPGRIRELLG